MKLKNKKHFPSQSSGSIKIPTEIHKKNSNYNRRHVQTLIHFLYLGLDWQSQQQMNEITTALIGTSTVSLGNGNETNNSLQ